METIYSMLSILYADWFIILMLLYMASAPLVLMRKMFPYPKKTFVIVLSHFAVILIGFYFIVPVPSYVQKKEAKFVLGYVNYNEEVVTMNMQTWMHSQCNSKYITGYQYFMFIDAFRKDNDATFKLKKSVSFGPVDDNFLELNSKKLCEISLKKVVLNS